MTAMTYATHHQPPAPLGDCEHACGPAVAVLPWGVAVCRVCLDAERAVNTLLARATPAAHTSGLRPLDEGVAVAR